MASRPSLAILLAIAAVAGALPAKSAPRGCADHWAVELDGESFANNGSGKTFTPAELADFRTRIQAALRTAAADACNGKKLPPSRAAAVRRVRVFSASGATEPHFYPAERGTLSLEWVFAEEALAVPAQEDMVAAVVCWADPTEKACSDEGD